MRILAIRGKNLASLRGEFELRLDQPPISSTNLFSISGPTGSGKSTLLDALCLALYGKTPRLSDEGGHAIGAPGEDEKLRLKSNDARALLSRGTADGFAQVDFQGADGKRCQATWRVHRAKNLGKFQPQTMSLMDLDSGDIISAQITEVRKSIETRIGFTFEEFKRTVLLPQFEFTNFLRAKPDDRAQILEHVMGGEVFSRLSKAAHERAASERDKLLRLQDKLGTIKPLSEDDRTQLDALTSTTDQALSEAKATAEKAGHDLAWYERQAVLAADLKSATSAFKEAEQHLALAAPLEKEVQAVSAAQPLRSVRDAAARTAATQSKAKAKLDETSSKLEQAGFALQKAGEELQEAESKLKITREQDATLRPEIDEARRLDSQIEPARRTAATARAECEKLRCLVEQGRDEVEQLARKIAESEAERSQTEQWLATHLAEGQLSAEWPRWEAELRKHSALGQELATIAAKLATAEEDVALVRRESGESAELASEAEEVFQAAQKSWEESEAAFGGRDLADLRARTSGLQDSLHKLEALAALAQQARAAQGASATARAQAEKFREAEERSKLEAARLAGELDGYRLRIAEARQAVDATRAVMSFDEQRSLLKDGQACPLCGSPDHPYAHSGLSSTAIDLLEKRVRELEQLGRELQSACSTAETEQAVARTNACSNENTANDLDAQAKQAQHSYRAQAATLVPDLRESAAETAAALQARIEEVQRRHDQAASEEENVLHRASERDRVREGLDPARAKWNSAVEKHAALMKNEMELTAVITRLAEDRTRLTQERDCIEALLNPVMSWHPDWALTARQSANAFLETCRGRNQEFATRQQGIETTSEKLSTMRANLETSRALLGERQTNLEISTTALQDLENALTDLRMKRHGCLQGRAAADVEAELKTLIGDATSNFETARSVHTGLTTARALADEAEKTAIKNLQDADQEAASTELALAAALARSGIDRQKLEERLAHNETWIAEQRKHLDTLRESVTREEARREERQRIFDHHSANDCPGVSHDLAQECAVNARAQAEDLGSKLIGLRAKQQQDDEVRLCHSSALADVRAQEESSRVWEQLDEVIGSADGKKFRVFAQSLAFEALVRDANAHLADLSPRYRLMSVPGAALELQVADQDLGSEVRTINSLSGGEVFLVSLALALGLSGISTRATQAQTLFIDEGFGTLDRDTLDHAMVALENLQATGRTVGIISHVPELQERFGAQVRVERAGCGKSRVVTVGP